jgi:hypothetical protein
MAAADLQATDAAAEIVWPNEEPRRKQRGIGSNRSSNRSKLRGINPREIERAGRKF